jgi:hypothetical protein
MRAMNVFHHCTAGEANQQLLQPSFGSRQSDTPFTESCVIRLKHSTIERTDFGCVTVFADGSHVNSIPHPGDPHYRVIAHRCGYNDDIHAYCYEHDFVHLFLAEWLHSRPSPILWGLAHGSELTGHEAALEEIGVQAFQRWIRANEQPIVGSVDWFRMREEALRLLAQAARHQRVKARADELAVS